MTFQERRIRVGDLLAARLRELADACSAAARGDKAAARILSDATDKYWFGLVVGPGQIETLYDDPYDDCDDDVIAGQIAEDAKHS